MALLGCTKGVELINNPPQAVARTTTGPWASMIYLARTDSGIIAVDLGWTGAGRALRRGLRDLGATPSEVRYVFLTHAHRDHTTGWSLVRQARFVLGAAEVPHFVGKARYRGWVPRLGDRLIPAAQPVPGDLQIIALGVDTAIALGRDTIFSYGVPGHTPGSTAYLFRGTLFGGEPSASVLGLQGREFSDDVRQSRASMHALWSRLPPAGPGRVQRHAKCAPADSVLRRRAAVKWLSIARPVTTPGTGSAPAHQKDVSGPRPSPSDTSIGARAGREAERHGPVVIGHGFAYALLLSGAPGTMTARRANEARKRGCRARPASPVAGRRVRAPDPDRAGAQYRHWPTRGQADRLAGGQFDSPLRREHAERVYPIVCTTTEPPGGVIPA